MSKLPQVNVRLAPEHHGLIRELAQRLRTDPSLTAGLADFLAQTSPSNQPQVSPLPHGLADEIAEMKERLDNHAQTSARIMAFAENINDRLTALEQQVADLRQKPVSAPLDAVEPVAVADTPVSTEALPEPSQKRQTRKPRKAKRPVSPPS